MASPNIQILFALFILLCALPPSFQQSADDDEVIIGIPDYTHRIFSGYFDISPIVDPKSIHYILYHSQNDVSKDPLILWLTGGPGCSSLIACFQENGPFVFKPSASTFTRNPEAWNKQANVLYIELPGGVGFSDGPNKVITDESTTIEAIQTLHNFFFRFPSLLKNDLYLAGHGYGAIFLSYLAQAILANNADPAAFQIYKLKGLLLGNPCMQPDQCYATGSAKLSSYHYNFLYKHSYFQKDDYETYRGTCALDYSSVPCFLVRQKLDALFDATNSSIYNVYDKCYKGQNDSLGDINSGCEDEAGVINYLSDDSFLENWNIKPGKKWEPCSANVFKNYHDNNGSYWLIPQLIKANLRIWVYSGDVDSSVPTAGTLRWVDRLRNELDMPQKRVWREWWVPSADPKEDQVGGFIWELRDLTVVTVRGAGYRTAIDQPKAMSEVLAGFLTGTTLPYKGVHPATE